MSACSPLNTFDWKSPDYSAVYADRARRLSWIRAHPGAVPALKAYYADHVAEFICHFGVTSDPRGALSDPPRPVNLPFILFERQVELVNFMLDCIRHRRSGIVEKSRDCGASWIAMAIAVSLCLFVPHTAVGIGSAKESLVDLSGDPSSLLWKARTFLQGLPTDFRGGWDPSKHSAHMRIMLPNGSSIVGQSGDEIGRGSRTSFFILDEAAHIPHDDLIDAALASTSDCVISISSVRGMGNSFARKRHSGKYPVFTFAWTSDPRKGPEWYQRQLESLPEVVIAQEVDISYHASLEGVLIPQKWVRAAIDAHEVLGIKLTGWTRSALDIADEGHDHCAIAVRHGVYLRHVEQWSGKGSDTYQSVARALSICDHWGASVMVFDSDGVGALARGDALAINTQRDAAGLRSIPVTPHRGSESPPLGQLVQGRSNQDYFSNRKAWAYWNLRVLFQNTYRAIVEKQPFDPDSIISIASTIPDLEPLLMQLSQPTYSISVSGKIVVDKAPQGAASPDLADAVAMCFARASYDPEIWSNL
jgi:hypothetical protein